MPARIVRTVQVEHAGQGYSGSYETVNGTLTVSSAYGSKSIPYTGQSPGRVATEMLKKIVEDYRR